MQHIPIKPYARFSPQPLRSWAPPPTCPKDLGTSVTLTLILTTTLSPTLIRTLILTCFEDLRHKLRIDEFLRRAIIGLPVAERS